MPPTLRVMTKGDLGWLVLTAVVVAIAVLALIWAVDSGLIHTARAPGPGQ